jgi:hypothetical protein
VLRPGAGLLADFNATVNGVQKIHEKSTGKHQWVETDGGKMPK